MCKNAQETHLNTASSHLELEGKLIPQRRIWLCIFFENSLQDLQLSRSCALAMLDLVGSIGIKGTKVDGGGVGRIWDNGTGVGAHSGCLGEKGARRKRYKFIKNTQTSSVTRNSVLIGLDQPLAHLGSL